MMIFKRMAGFGETPRNLWAKFHMKVIWHILYVELIK